jgi:hypothetical protein
MARAMNSYLAFYRLQVQGSDDEELDAAIEAFHASLGIEKGVLAYFLAHVHRLLPDSGEPGPASTRRRVAGAHPRARSRGDRQRGCDLGRGHAKHPSGTT